MKLRIGDKAPDFSLYNTEKESITLSNYKGKKVVLLFFPLAFTGVCTEELCSIRDEMAVYNDLDAVVLGISVDSPFTLGEFKKAQNYNFDLLSDFNKEVSRAYGCLYEEFVLDMKGVSKRSAFVIDENGILKYVEVLDNAGNIPNFVTVKEVLGKL